MEDTAQANGPTPPPLPGKRKYKPAWYAKLMLGITILVNARVQFYGEEFGPRTVGALIGSVVIMPCFLLTIALIIWRITGRQSLPANIVLTCMSFLFLMLSLIQLGEKASGI